MTVSIETSREEGEVKGATFATLLLSYVYNHFVPISYASFIVPLKQICRNAHANGPCELAH
jgi:hypothetical protein